MAHRWQVMKLTGTLYSHACRYKHIGMKMNSIKWEILFSWNYILLASVAFALSADCNSALFRSLITNEIWIPLYSLLCFSLFSHQTSSGFKELCVRCSWWSTTPCLMSSVWRIWWVKLARGWGMICFSAVWWLSFPKVILRFKTVLKFSQKSPDVSYIQQSDSNNTNSAADCTTCHKWRCITSRPHQSHYWTVMTAS